MTDETLAVRRYDINLTNGEVRESASDYWMHACYHDAHIRSLLAAQAEEVRRLREALGGYGKHSIDCGWKFPPHYECDCGLGVALTPRGSQP